MSYRCCRYSGTVDCYPCIDYSKFRKFTTPQSSPKAPKPDEGQRTPGQSSIRQVIRRLPMEVWNGEYL